MDTFPAMLDNFMPNRELRAEEYDAIRALFYLSYTNLATNVATTPCTPYHHPSMAADLRVSENYANPQHAPTTSNNSEIDGRIKINRTPDDPFDQKIISPIRYNEHPALLLNNYIHQEEQCLDLTKKSTTVEYKSSPNDGCLDLSKKKRNLIHESSFPIDENGNTPKRQKSQLDSEISSLYRKSLMNSQKEHSCVYPKKMTPTKFTYDGPGNLSTVANLTPLKSYETKNVDPCNGLTLDAFELFRKCKETFVMKRTKYAKARLIAAPPDVCFNPNKSRITRLYTDEADEKERSRNNEASRRSRIKKKFIFQAAVHEMEYTGEEIQKLQGFEEWLDNAIKTAEIACEMVAGADKVKLARVKSGFQA